MKRYSSRRVLSALFLFFCFPQIASAEPFQTIVNNGAPENRVDIAILGDGYTAAEMQKYRDDVEALIQAFFLGPPFREYKTFFNVHRIDVISNQSGADHPERTPAVFKDTALDATYNCAGSQRLICVNISKVNFILVNTLTASQHDLTFVIVNDPEYGGSGGSIAVASTHREVVELVLHEIGHTFGFLADEYGGPPPPVCNNTVEPSAVNATKVTERSLIKWNHWIDPSTPIPTTILTQGLPGLYEGAVYCDTGLYRPTNGSKMRFLGRPYEQINTEQLIKRIYNFVSPIDSSEPGATDITITHGQAQTFRVSTLTTLDGTISIEWYLNGQLQSTGTELTVNSINLSGGAHVVEARVKDNTQLVRKDTENLLSDIHKWNLTVNAVPTPTPTPTPTPSPTPTPVPALLTEQNSARAIALDSVTFLRDPFPVSGDHNFSLDGRTRIILFATNVELKPGEDVSILSVQGEDAQQSIFPLTVEYVGKVPNQDWLTQISIRLPDNPAIVGDIWISIKLRGVQSNKVLISIRRP